MSALVHPAGKASERGDESAAGAKVRFGFTVARYQARRAVARNTVKRVLREAARHASEALIAAACTQRVDIVLRLKAALPERRQASWSSVKTELRRQADSLLQELRQQLVRPQAQGVRRGIERTDARS